MTRLLRSTELPIDQRCATARPTSTPPDSIDQSRSCLSFAASVNRSFHVAGRAGSCHTQCAWRTRMSAIQSLYDARSASTGRRNVVVLPRIVPPSAMDAPPPAGELLHIPERVAPRGHCDEVAEPLTKLRRPVSRRVDETHADSDVLPRQRPESPCSGRIGPDRRRDIAWHDEPLAQAHTLRGHEAGGGHLSRRHELAQPRFVHLRPWAAWSSR